MLRAGFSDDVIGLANHMATFRVTQNPFHTAVLKHGQGHFTGEGSGRLVVGVLAPSIGVPIRRHLRSVRGKERQGTSPLLPREGHGQSFRDGFGEVCTVSRVEVHFPVAANNWSSHEQILFGEKRHRLAESLVFRTQEIAMESVQLIPLESNHAPTAAEVRQQFLDFFAQRHQHTVVDSRPGGSA